eukprot:scaffold4186_cov33-Prasinocladus_malaysianus.AAC.3
MNLRSARFLDNGGSRLTPRSLIGLVMSKRGKTSFYESRKRVTYIGMSTFGLHLSKTGKSMGMSQRRSSADCLSRVFIDIGREICRAD